jgi:L-ascorbate metabolism protein UlaG (beta-lactamase superfamily)
MKITWLGHSCFELVESLNVLIDPYISNAHPIQEIGDFNPDVIAVTHGHSDHLGNAAEIARRTGCLVLSTPEVTGYLDRRGARAESMNIGGSFPLGICLIHMTYAQHSSAIKDAGSGHFADQAAGYVIDDGTRVYHAGDTGLFSDMRLLAELYRPQVALLPIGGRYTMGPREAAIAVNWLRPDIAIPMHYNTRASIEQDPADFQALVETLCDTEVLVMETGETIEL